MSIHWPIIRSLVRRPLHTFIVDDNRSYRGVDLLVGALHIAGELAAKSTSQTVGLLLPSSGMTPMAALAAWMLGKTVVPLNYLLKPEELRYVVNDCGCDTIIAVQPMLDFVNKDAPPTAPPLPEHVRVLRLEDVDFKGVPEFRWPAMGRDGARDEDLALLLYTSGTTGRPKGVMLTHGNLSANIRQIMEWVDFTRAEVMLGVLPQFHTFGMTVLTLLPLAIGCRAVYTAKFVPGKIVRLLREHRATVLVAIPSMYNALLRVKDATPEDFASLRYVVSGGEPLPAAVRDAFQEKFGVTINEGYGLTETAPVSNWCRPEEFRPGSVGRALPRIEQKIVDIETGRTLPANADGEVRMRGPNIFGGYYHLPEETAAAFDERGFFRTGDIGRLDDDGHLHITGRLKEMLIVGGENVFPREIEEALNAHPDIKDSGVIGKADPVRGELPIAFVEMTDEFVDANGNFDEQSLKDWCRERLAGYKVPVEIRRVDALPRNPTGKVMRRELKKLTA